MELRTTVNGEEFVFVRDVHKKAQNKQNGLYWIHDEWICGFRYYIKVIQGDYAEHNLSFEVVQISPLIPRIHMGAENREVVVDLSPLSYCPASTDFWFNEVVEARKYALALGQLSQQFIDALNEED